MDWRDEAKEAVTEFPGDVRSAVGKTYDIIKNDNNPSFDPQRRNVVQGAGLLLAGGIADFTEDGDLDSYDTAANLTGSAAGAAGDFFYQAGKASPFEIRSPITWKGKEAENNNTPGAQSNQNGGGVNNSDNGGSTDPSGTDTGSGTGSSGSVQDLAYESISQGLLEESERTRQGFKGYSLTALDNQLEGVGVEEAVENSSDYEAAIRNALEGTEYFEDDAVFRLGEYGVTEEDEIGRGVDLDGQIGASDKFVDYMAELDDGDQTGDLEDKLFGYFEDLEKI